MYSLVNREEVILFNITVIKFVLVIIIVLQFEEFFTKQPVKSTEFVTFSFSVGIHISI